MKKKICRFLPSFIVFDYFISRIVVLADQCPPSSTQGQTTGASSLFGGGVYSLMDGAQYGGLVYAILVLLLLLLVLLVFAINKNKNKFNKSCSSPLVSPYLEPMGQANVQQSDGTCSSVGLNPGSNPIGKASNNTIQLNDPKVSSHHADLWVSKDRYTLTDLNSTNGTFVNGQKITQQDVYQGDQIQIGDSRIFV